MLAVKPELNRGQGPVSCQVALGWPGGVRSCAGTAPAHTGHTAWAGGWPEALSVACGLKQESGRACQASALRSTRGASPSEARTDSLENPSPVPATVTDLCPCHRGSEGNRVAAVCFSCFLMFSSQPSVGFREVTC